MCEEGSWQQIELAQENGDYKKMAALLLPLAENGDEEAQYTLAGLCEAGNGVRKSLKKAFLWYEKAALKNHVLA
jgi:sel1 repeat domain-containing protein